MKLTKKEATNFFAQLFGSEHAIPSKVRKYAEGYGVHTAQTLATFDSDLLTRIVNKANENGVRAVIYPHSSTRQLIIIQRLKKHDQAPAVTSNEATKPGAYELGGVDMQVNSKLPPQFVYLATHPERERIISKMPPHIQYVVRHNLDRGVAMLVDAKSILDAPRDVMWRQFAQDNYQHMCDAHPDFATAFKPYLNAMSLDEAINAAERDLSPPACLSLREVGEYYQSLPDDQR